MIWYIALTIALVAAPAWGASLRVSWNAPTTNEDGSPLTDLAGYRLYFDGTPCPSPQHATVGNVTDVIVNDLAPSTTYTARVTAIDTYGNESVCSVMASGTTAAAAPVQALTGTLSLAFSADSPGLTATPNPVQFSWIRGQALPAAKSVTISGGSGIWFTKDTNPWADVSGGTWNQAQQRMDFSASATSFTIIPSNGMLSLAIGTHTQTIQITRGSLTTTVTVRAAVT